MAIVPYGDIGYFGSAVISSLTATRLVYASTAGLLADSANLTFNGTTLTAGGFTTAGAVTAASFVIGANTLDTNEWAYLDGQDQAVKSSDSPTFVDLTVTSIVIGANTLNTDEWANLDGQDQTVATTSSPTFVGLTTTGGRVVPVRTVTDTATVLPANDVVICNKETAFTVTLETSAVVGQRHIIKNIGAGLVTLEGDGADTIDDELNQAIYQWDCIVVQCAAANTWEII